MSKFNNAIRTPDNSNAVVKGLREDGQPYARHAAVFHILTLTLKRWISGRPLGNEKSTIISALKSGLEC